jgi:hypothetical protein
MQDLFELRLGSMTVVEYEKKFLGLLKYVGFIKDDKVNTKRFLSVFPSLYKENIQYDEPITLIDIVTTIFLSLHTTCLDGLPFPYADLKFLFCAFHIQKGYFSTYTCPISYKTSVYTSCSTISHIHQKLKIMLGFHAMSRDP